MHGRSAVTPEAWAGGRVRITRLRRPMHFHGGAAQDGTKCDSDPPAIQGDEAAPQQRQHLGPSYLHDGVQAVIP